MRNTVLQPKRNHWTRIYAFCRIMENGLEAVGRCTLSERPVSEKNPSPKPPGQNGGFCHWQNRSSLAHAGDAMEVSQEPSSIFVALRTELTNLPVQSFKT